MNGNKNRSRVLQLRDLFQLGKSCPAEDLKETDLCCASSFHPSTCDLRDPQTIICNVKTEYETSLSDIDNSSLKSFSDMSEPETANPTTRSKWILTNRTRSSESDLDSDVDAPPQTHSKIKMDNDSSYDIGGQKPTTEHINIIKPINVQQYSTNPQDFISNGSVNSLGAKTELLSSDYDSDVDNRPVSEMPEKGSVSKLVQKLELMKPANKTIITDSDSPSFSNHERTRTDQSNCDLLENHNDKTNISSQFQDFLLESTHFQVEAPLLAENVEVDDYSTSEDDDDDYVIVPRMSDSSCLQINAHDDDACYQSICPQSRNNMSEECDCHILCDGNYFYERIIQIDQIESELECQHVKKQNNEVVKTYKMPGAKVHFLLDKVRVYSTHLAEEYDRRNQDIDPLLSSAEYEMEKRLEKMDTFHVEIFKGTKGLGISILGMGVSHKVGMQKLGIFVKSIIKGGPADENGKIQIYDQIIEVNGQSLVGVSQEFAASALRNAHGVVHFLIGREKSHCDSEIVRLIDRSRQLQDPQAVSEDVHKKNDVLKEVEKVEEFKGTFNNGSVASNEYVPNNISSSTVGTQTQISGIQLQSNENLLSNMNTAIQQSRLNEENLRARLSELNVVAQNNITLNGKVEILSKSYTELQARFAEVLSDFLRSQKCCEALSEENTLLKLHLEATMFKKDSLRNGNGENVDLEKSRSRENFLENEGDLTASKFRSSGFENELIQPLSSESNCNGRVKEEQFLEDSNSDVEEEGTVNKKESLDNGFMIPSHKLDNHILKNKIELKKRGPIAHRKPPSRSMMIGDGSVEDHYKEDVRNKPTSKKVFGGFSLPGKNEIKLGIKPSSVAEIRKSLRLVEESLDSDDITESRAHSANSSQSNSRNGFPKKLFHRDEDVKRMNNISSQDQVDTDNNRKKLKTSGNHEGISNKYNDSIPAM